MVKTPGKVNKKTLLEDEIDNAEAEVTFENFNESELNELANEFGSFDETTNEINQTGSDENCNQHFENFGFKVDELMKFDDFKEQQNKITAFLSSEFSEYCDTTSNRRPCELSCIREEEHVELNESNPKEDDLMSEKDSTLLTNIENKNEKLSLSASLSSTNSDLSNSSYSIEKGKDMRIEDPIMLTTPTHVAVSKSSNLNKNNDDCQSSFNYFSNISRNNDFTFISSNTNTPQQPNPNSSMNSLASIYFKPSSGHQHDSTLTNETIKFDQNSLTGTDSNNTLDNMFEKCTDNERQSNINFGMNFSMNAFNQQALLTEQAGFSMGEFKSGEELLNDFEMLETTKEIGERSWWHVNDQQASKLELSNTSSNTVAASTTSTNKQVTTHNVAVDDYFNKKSCLPKFLMNDENKSLLDLTKEFLAPDKDTSNASKCEKQSTNESINNKLNNTDFTFSTPAGTTQLENCFSFTLNSSETGDFVQKIDKNRPEKETEHINSTLKSESVGIKPPVLSTKPINSINIKTIGDDLERISNLLSNRAETMNGSEKPPFIKTNKPKPHATSASQSSITSTPAKVASTSTESNEPSVKNQLFNQDSFLSSIPDRGDTDAETTVTSCDSLEKNFKKASIKCNAEMQTSPLKQQPQPQQQNDNINTTSTSISSLLTSAVAAAAANSMNGNNANLNGVIPVAFLPMHAFFPCMQKFYDDIQNSSNKIDPNSQTLLNLNKIQIQQYMQQQSRKESFPDYDSLFQYKKQEQRFSRNSDVLSTPPDREYSTIDNRLSFNSQSGLAPQFIIPQIEVDKRELDFNYISEGCHDLRSFSLKEVYNQNNSNNNNKFNYYMLIEINESTLKIKNCQNENDLRFKLSKIFSLAIKPTGQQPPIDYQRSRFIKIETSNGRPYEINFHVDATELNVYKDLISMQQTRQFLQPFEISLNVTISCCHETFHAHQQQHKILLNQIEVKFILGFVKLKTNVDVDSIDFLIEKKVFKNRIDYVVDENKKQKLVPISNAGNIPVKLKCYLFDRSINDNLVNYCIRVNSEMISFDEFCSNKVIDVTLEKKVGSNKLESTLNDEEQQNEANLSTKLIVEVMPNGGKYEIPVKLKVQEIQMEPNIVEKSKEEASKRIRILASKTVLQFGTCEVDDYLVENLILMNPNDFNVKCVIHAITMDDKHEKCEDNLFFFESPDNKFLLTQIIEIKSKEQTSLKIRFQPKHVSSSTSLCNGFIQIRALNYELRFNAQIIGFIGKGRLFVDNLVKQTPVTNSLAGINYSLKNDLIQSAEQYKVCLNPVKKIQGRTFFSKDICLTNKSSTSKCFLNTVIFDKTFNKTISTAAKLNTTDSFVILNENETFNLNFEFEASEKTAVLIENNKINVNLLVMWLEYDPFLYCHQLIHKKLQATPEIVDENKAGFDLDRHIYQNILLKKYNFMSTSENQNVSLVSNTSTTSALNITNDAIYSQFIKKAKITKDDLVKFFKSILKYSLITLVLDLDASKIPIQQSVVPSVKNPSTANVNSGRLPDILFKKEPIPLNNSLKSARFSLSNESVNKSQSKQLGSSNSCSNLGDLNNSSRYSINLDGADTINNTTSLQSIDHLLDFTLNKTVEDEAKNKMEKNEVILSSSSGASSNGWSISPTEINLSINESTYDKQETTIVLTNCLNKELVYDIIYRSVCLNIQNSKGTLLPKGQVKIRVQIKKDILNKLPWLGAISVLCNKSQKDIRVYITHKSSEKLPPLPAKASNATNCSASISTGNLTNASMKNSTALEQGTLLSEITQYSLDTLSLTPLINASFCSQMNSFSGVLANNKSQMFKKKASDELCMSNSSKMLNETSDKSVKIVRIGKDAHISFPNVDLGSSSNVELTLSNTNRNYVRWKSFSTGPAFIRTYESEDNESTSSSVEEWLKISQQSMLKSSYSVFIISPTSGIIPPMQKQVIKIEFYPREATGLFTQHWEIDTRTDNSGLNSVPNKNNFGDSYNCKLILTGNASSSDTSGAKVETAKVLTNRENLRNENTKLSIDRLSSSLNKISNKENNNSKTSKSSVKNKILIKEEILEFPDTAPGQMSKMSIEVDNSDERGYELTVMKILEPFNCKYTKIVAKSKHYIRIPIEFKPLVPGDYVDKILIRVDSIENPLVCKIRGKCKSS